ncbi:4-hydroxyphenylpyruvate dioxygenase [Pseudonocardia acaciae]|uniref:4-hydroxyphenylpyruvate dioxygenase n=1 Tax=Pseudonocardia acaciae TaxID=551276 RepID=UPI000563BEED|nr:4-hydroxyphenylpyruvate dioxygenase [Pseudonocardia acaciae]
MTNRITCDHVQLYVEDVRATSEELVSKYGFEILWLPRKNRYKTALSTVLGQGSIVLVLTEPTGLHAGHEYLAAHGDGIVGIGFRCDDVHGVYKRAVVNGAHPIAPPRPVESGYAAALKGPGDIMHTLVEQAPDSTMMLLPEVGLIPRREPACEVGLRTIDHFALCVPRGELGRVVAMYTRAWGFERIFQETIAVGAQAMDSVVVASPGGGIALTLIEPAGGEPGQIDHFVDRHGGAGVQHIAFATDDIVATVSELYTRGVKFGATPSAYYTGLAKRAETLRHGVLRLRSLGILVDHDHGGELYQIFTQSTHRRRTYFTEIIERDGASTFGSNNIRLLYEAKKREMDQLVEQHSEPA